MISEVLQGIYMSLLMSPRVECLNPCSQINRTQGFAVRPVRVYPLRHLTSLDQDFRMTSPAASPASIGS